MWTWFVRVGSEPGTARLGSGRHPPRQGSSRQVGPRHRRPTSDVPAGRLRALLIYYAVNAHAGLCQGHAMFTWCNHA